jgi:hypothetical protein
MQDRRQKIQRRIDSDLARMAKLGAMLKGTVSEVKLGQRKRGDGQRIAYLLTYKGEGNRTRSVYVPADRVAEVGRMIDNHRKAKAILDRIVELNVALFKIKQ